MNHAMWKCALRANKDSEGTYMYQCSLIWALLSVYGISDTEDRSLGVWWLDIFFLHMSQKLLLKGTANTFFQISAWMLRDL